MRFIEELKTDDRDLPWANEYLDGYGQAEDISKVFKLIPGTKGILVLTELFKGFIFKGSTTHDYLLDAIQVWKQDGRLPFLLFAQVLESGKIRVAVDDQGECVVVVDKRGNVEFKFPKDDSGSEETPSNNPFILGSPVPTMSADTKDKGKSSRKARMPY